MSVTHPYNTDCSNYSRTAVFIFPDNSTLSIDVEFAIDIIFLIFLLHRSSEVKDSLDRRNSVLVREYFHVIIIIYIFIVQYPMYINVRVQWTVHDMGCIRKDKSQLVNLFQKCSEYYDT